MNWKSSTNDLVRRTTGYRIIKDRRLGDAPAMSDGVDRHLVAPVFIMSSVRSGSTLLRSVMGGHSALHAPHELHLRDIRVDLATDYAVKAMDALGLAAADLEYVLWDCVLARQVELSGKRHLINKTPNDIFIWRRITKCWPDARFVYLRRHPYAIVRSWHRARPHWSEEEAIENALRYMDKMDEAGAEWPGVTVRYEDLTEDPTAVGTRICEFLGLDWEPAMLDYASEGTDGYRAGLGDWSKKIRSGRIQAAEPLPAPEDVPPLLKDICGRWGYL